MYDDIIEKKSKRLTVDDITWDKNCGNCRLGDIQRTKIVGLVYCIFDNTHKMKDYFCYEWQAKKNLLDI